MRGTNAQNLAESESGAVPRLDRPPTHREFERAAQSTMAQGGQTDAASLLALTLSLSRATTRFERDLDLNAYRPVGLSLSAYRILFSLCAMGPLRPGDLSDLTGLAPGSVTSILTRLEADGHIDRRRNETNRRESIVTVTPSGRALTNRAMKASAARQERWLSAFTRGEVIELTRLLHRLIDHDPDSPTFGDN
ncbi:MarR family winged helix-turn-helix transcriptional regulator [Gulosibacter molinativorax]|uniref:MarR family winged helix-turn-helix transcriptional regulator n=1 Tax=Gulosibacter molinativorax TaxID=256821 RepID=UPI0004077240|nr:MarR family winged helix-turn-helix transcriptional regulator [Gulosibacter molinativorax]